MESLRFGKSIALAVQVCAAFGALCAVPCSAAASPASADSGSLYLVVLSTASPKAFVSALEQELSAATEKLGLRTVLLPPDSADVSQESDPLALLLVTQVVAEDDSIVTTAGILKKGLYSPSNVKRALDHPLATLVLAAGDSSAAFVLASKIAENLRVSHLCHLTVQSTPPGARIVASNGLSANTPVEWVVPVSDLTVTLTLEQYHTFSRRLQIDKPGSAYFSFDLRKRFSLRSPLSIAALGCAALSGASFALDRSFYTRYERLDQTTMETAPEKFASTYRTARTFELLSQALGASAGVFLGLSIIF